MNQWAGMAVDFKLTERTKFCGALSRKIFVNNHPAVSVIDTGGGISLSSITFIHKYHVIRNGWDPPVDHSHRGHFFVAVRGRGCC